MPEHGCRSFLSLGDQAQPQTKPSAAAPPSQRGGYPQNLSGQAPAGALSIGTVTADTKDALPRFLCSFSSCCLSRVSKVCQRITLHKHMILTGQPHSHAWKNSPSEPQEFSVRSRGTQQDHWRQTNHYKLGYSAQASPFPNPSSLNALVQERNRS